MKTLCKPRLCATAVFVFFATFAHGNKSYCTQVFRSFNGPHRQLASIDEFKIGTYNVLDFGPSKSKENVAAIAQIIRESNPDILVMQEVQGYGFLVDFVRTHLNSEYDVLMTPIPEANSIQTGFLVKKDLPLYLELDTHINEMWVDPAKADKSFRKLFPRDLPVLKISSIGQDESQGKHLFMVMGTHLKSKRDRRGDVESRILRKAQADRAAQIIQTYREASPQTPVMVVGDFNGSVATEAEYASFRTLAQLDDAMAVEQMPPADGDTVTHTFFARSGDAINSQLDYVLLTPDLKDAVIEGEVYRYKDPAGRLKPLPQSSMQRDENPSDHFPYFVRMKFQKILTLGKGRKPDGVKRPWDQFYVLSPRNKFRVKFVSPHIRPL